MFRTISMTINNTFYAYWLSSKKTQKFIEYKSNISITEMHLCTVPIPCNDNGVL